MESTLPATIADVSQHPRGKRATLLRVLSYRMIVHSCLPPEQAGAIVELQDAEFRAEFDRLGMRLLGATKELVLSMPGLTIQRATYVSDDGLVVGTLGAYNTKRWFFFHTLFEDGGAIYTDSDTNRSGGSKDFAVGTALLSFPAAATVAESYAYHRAAVEHHVAAGRRPVRFDTIEDALELRRHYNRHLITPREAGMILVMPAIFLFVVVGFALMPLL